MTRTEHVDTPDEAEAAVAAALASVAEGRTVKVSPDDLDRYFDALKAQAGRGGDARTAG